MGGAGAQVDAMSAYSLPWAAEPCCGTCAGCERTYCRDAEPSPGEADGICPTCWDIEDDQGDE